MPALLLPRSDVVRRLAGAFRQHGYGGASLKILSEATGLGRSSLYHHFPEGKADMGAAVLADAAEWLRGHVLNALAGEGTPEQRLDKACKGLLAFYEGGKLSCLLELFSTGEAQAEFGSVVAEGFGAIQRAFAALARGAGLSDTEADRRSEDVLIAIQGSLVLSRALRSEQPFQRVISEMPGRLLGQA
jgi:AcrR family transcriptional regulator